MSTAPSCTSLVLLFAFGQESLEGKTWLLNKLFGVNLPAGKLCTTRGMSFLWIKERRMLLLDSAGVQATVNYRKQAVDAIHDAMTTESLMFRVISRSIGFLFHCMDAAWMLHGCCMDVP